MAVIRLHRQLGAGPDGTACLGSEGADGKTVEVWVLRELRARAERWPAVVKRLQVASRLDHPNALQIRQLHLDHDPPFLVVPMRTGQTLAQKYRGGQRPDVATVLRLGYQLADVLAAASRIGLGHGRLAPGAVRLVADNRPPVVDFTGLDCDRSTLTGTRLAFEAACTPPEGAGPGGDPSGDTYSLGAMLHGLLLGQPARPGAEPKALAVALQNLPPPGGWWAGVLGPLAELFAALLSTEPALRPRPRHAATRFARLLELTEAVTLRSQAPPGDFAAEPMAEEAEEAVALRPGECLGRYRLVAKLGEGGMGAVWKAEDTADGSTVAVKVMRGASAATLDDRQRFFKEARLLAQVNSPYVANLLEFNEDRGILYLALEYVPGPTVAALLRERGRFDEPTALAVAADVCRALADAHQRGIVHRDVKPENLLVSAELGVRSAERSELPALRTPRSEFHAVKLTDFGLARQQIQTGSLNLTQTGTVVGTPYYMAPEQCRGAAVDPRTDVYAIGATLFHLLAGRPPFDAESALGVLTAHLNQAPPPLRQFHPQVSEATAAVVARCLAKAPEDRYLDAAALLRDLDRLRRGEPTDLALHPRLPEAADGPTLAWDFAWELSSPRQTLWPLVSHTERLNKAIGLPAVSYRTQHDPVLGPRRFAEARIGGMRLAWEEHPFEWIEGRRMGVVREFSAGPFKWFLSTVELEPRADGGTTLRHRIRIVPRGLLGRLAAFVEVSLKARRQLARVYRRLDRAAAADLGQLEDPFEPAAPPPGPRQKRLRHVRERLVRRGVDLAVADRLVEFVARAPDQEAARLRPLAFARRFGLDPARTLAGCLHAVREGLLVLLWDIICPVCRIPSDVQDVLAALQDHGHCQACDADFQLDFAQSVEVIFRAHPEVRDVAVRTYCAGGPGHSPHVVAQVRLQPGERIDLDLTLPEGAYRLRGPQLPYQFDLRIGPGEGRRRWDVALGRPAAGAEELAAGGQLVGLTNDTGRRLLVRLERTAARHDALTAAQASALALFRELFPDQVLAPGRTLSVASVALLVTQLEQGEGLYKSLGDAQAFNRIHESIRVVEGQVRAEGGAFVKTVSEGVTAAFHDPLATVRTALGLQAALDANAATNGLRLRVGVHRGTAMVATVNDRLDYFGTTVKATTQLLRFAEGGGVILTQSVTQLPEVAALLQEQGLTGTILEERAAALPEEFLVRVAAGEE